MDELGSQAWLDHLYRRAFERTRSEAQGKPERAPVLMRRTPWHRHVDAKARGY